MPRQPETSFALDYLAQSLARDQARWGEEVLALLHAVAKDISQRCGSVSEAELAAWCRMRGLPSPRLKHLFGGTRTGEWRFLTAGMWRYEPKPLETGSDWPRRSISSDLDLPGDQWLPRAPVGISDQRAAPATRRKLRARAPRKGKGPE
jgi:hypothetical protein